MTYSELVNIKINGIEKSLLPSEALSLCYQLVTSQSTHFIPLATQLFEQPSLDKKNRQALYQLVFNFALKNSHYELLHQFSGAAIQHDEYWEMAYYAKALAYRYLRQPFDAKNALIQAITLAPEQIAWQRLLGRMYQELGDFERAKQQFELCLSMDNEDIESYWLLSDIQAKLPEQQAELLASLIDNQTLSTADIAHACFTLYRHFDACKQYQRAFNYLEKGNRALSTIKPFNIEKEQREHQAIERCFSNQAMNRASESLLGDKSIFICGLPRSGTTLVEQILASHVEINAGDELFYLAQASQEHMKAVGSNTPFPDWATTLTNKDWHKIGEKYLVKCQHLAQDKWLTDKMPLNYKAIGIINNALPQAKIIYCRRNREDTIWGCYKQILGQGNNFSNNLADMQAIYDAHAQLMNHWLSCLPNNIFIVDYEQLVNDQQSVIVKLCQFIGVDYQPQMLSFYQNSHPVHTVSSAQVRKAITTAHIADWRKYQEFLPDL